MFHSPSLRNARDAQAHATIVETSTHGSLSEKCEIEPQKRAGSKKTTKTSSTLLRRQKLVLEAARAKAELVIQAAHLEAEAKVEAARIKAEALRKQSKLLEKKLAIELELVDIRSRLAKRKSGDRKNESQAASIVLSDTSEKAKGQYCELTAHEISNCPKRECYAMTSGDLQEQSDLEKCLGFRHIDPSTCQGSNCDVEGCGQPHHRLLHWVPSRKEAQQESQPNDNKPSSESDQQCEMVTHTAASQCPKVLLKIGAKLVSESEIVSVDMTNYAGERYNLSVRKIKQFNLPMQKISAMDPKCEHIQKIKDSKLSKLCECGVQAKVLIGQDHHHLITSIVCVRGKEQRAPYLTKTAVGWCVHGCLVSDFTQSSSFVSLAHDQSEKEGINTNQIFSLFTLENNDTIPSSADDSCSSDPDTQLENIIKNSFSLDSIGICSKPRQIASESRAIDILNRTAVLNDKKWTVGLQWRYDIFNLPDSYPDTVKRLNSIQKKLLANKDYAFRFRERIQHLLLNDFARELRDDDECSNSHVWYLPHFSVDNPRKRKLRLVFDCASRSKGSCLNDFLLQGPDLLQSLLGIMFRFREYAIGTVADIQDMHLRIKIRKIDCNAFRFLWENKKFIVTSLVFGACCSPFVAQYVNQVHTVSNEENEIYLHDLPVPDARRFSCWLRLLRATAIVLLFIKKCRKKNNTQNLDVELLKEAEILLIKYHQGQSFSDEIIALKKKLPIKKESRLRSLTPFLDSDEVLRVGGRIDAAEGVDDTLKKPVILDGKDHMSRLLVKSYHIRAHHSYNEMVVNELRQKYWILNLRPTVRTVASQCLICRIRRASPVPARLGDLPKDRLTHHQRPFTVCGVDLFGPMDVAVGRQRQKRYGVLFTCMTVRAVHIEVVPSLTADSLIMALRRMAARRGWPHTIMSDNGTNMRGASTELKAACKDLNYGALTDEALNKSVNWKFISPASPHMGGAWERLIRSVKTALKVVLKERAPKEETLITLFAEVENIINSRPLTHVSVDPSSKEALTPNHFLLGSSSNLPIPGKFDDGDLYLRRQWRITQRLVDLFWQRWMKEVLPALIPRHKWTQEGLPHSVGDLVIVVDPSSPRNSWPRGIITKVYPGSDGRVRVVDIKTKSGVMKRPVTRVASLAIHDECRTGNTGGENVTDVETAPGN